MSEARLEGNVPKPARVLGVIDEHARMALREATQQVVLPAARDEAPGGLGRAMTASVRRTPEGYRAVVQASPRRAYKGSGATGAQVVRWVTRGTGVYRRGPGPKRPITSKRGVLGTMTLPGGLRVRSVRGQRPNPFVARAEDRTRARVNQVMHESARRAAAALGRLR
jgi:hypothetical protein